MSTIGQTLQCYNVWREILGLEMGMNMSELLRMLIRLLKSGEHIVGGYKGGGGSINLHILNGHARQSPTLGAHSHAHGFWVGMGAIFVHGWAWVLCNHASNSKSESNFSDAGNTLIKKHSGLKPTIVNDFLFVRSNQDLV
jgi:hypothetical protein